MPSTVTSTLLLRTKSLFRVALAPLATVNAPAVPTEPTRIAPETTMEPSSTVILWAFNVPLAVMLAVAMSVPAEKTTSLAST